jgi:hypothetical protein
VVEHAEDAENGAHLVEAAEAAAEAATTGVTGAAAELCGGVLLGTATAQGFGVFVAMNIVRFYQQCTRDCVNYKCPMPGGRGYLPPCRMEGAPPIWLQPIK